MSIRKITADVDIRSNDSGLTKLNLQIQRLKTQFTLLEEKVKQATAKRVAYEQQAHSKYKSMEQKRLSDKKLTESAISEVVLNGIQKRLQAQKLADAKEKSINSERLSRMRREKARTEGIRIDNASKQAFYNEQRQSHQLYSGLAVGHTIRGFGMGVQQAVTTPLFDFYKASANFAGEMQQIRVSFETLIGDKAQSDAAIKDLRLLARTTPFTYRDVLKIGQQLAMTKALKAEQITPFIRTLGDATGGSTPYIMRVIKQWSDAYYKQYASLQDIRPMTSAGVPIMEALSKVTGKSVAEINESVIREKGITFDILMKAIVEAARMRPDLMQKLSDTLPGDIDKLQSAIQDLQIVIGDVLSQGLRPTIKALVVLVDSFNNFLLAHPKAGTAMVLGGIGAMTLGPLVSGIGNLIIFASLLRWLRTSGGIMKVITSALGIGGIAGGVAKTAGVAAVATKSPGVMSKIGKIASDFGLLIATVMPKIGPAITKLFGWVFTGLSKVGPLISRIGPTILRMLPLFGRLSMVLLRLAGPVGFIVSGLIMLYPLFKKFWAFIAPILRTAGWLPDSPKVLPGTILPDMQRMIINNEVKVTLPNGSTENQRADMQLIVDKLFNVNFNQKMNASLQGAM